MTARMQFVVRDFALHPHSTELCFERAADLSCQFADSENLGCLVEEVSGQFHVARESPVLGISRDSSTSLEMTSGARRGFDASVQRR